MGADSNVHHVDIAIYVEEGESGIKSANGHGAEHHGDSDAMVKISEDMQEHEVLQQLRVQRQKYRAAVATHAHWQSVRTHQLHA